MPQICRVQRLQEMLKFCTKVQSFTQILGMEKNRVLWKVQNLLKFANLSKKKGIRKNRQSLQKWTVQKLQ